MASIKTLVISRLNAANGYGIKKKRSETPVYTKRTLGCLDSLPTYRFKRWESGGSMF